jgi:hypothetical protein
LFEGAKSSGESGADGGDRNSGALKVSNGIGDVGVVDTDGTGVNGFDIESFLQVGSDWLTGFGAEAVDVAGGVVTAESGQVNAFDGADEVGGLMVFLDGSAFGECVSTAV